MVKRINLWGGPGIGKSTLAASIFAKLKMAGESVEMTQEYVKAWAYEKRIISSFDQLYIFAKQQRLEERVLRAGVGMLVTDSPLLMQCVYAKQHGFSGYRELLNLGKLFEEEYPSINYQLRRTPGLYQQEGRYQNEIEAKAIDKQISEFMEINGIRSVVLENDADAIVEHLQSVR